MITPLIIASDLPSGILVLLFIAVGIISVPLLYLVHRAFDRRCLRHARKHCAKLGYRIERWKVSPAFDSKGVKTEFTLVEFDCFDHLQQRRLVRLIVWVFGVRKTLIDEPWSGSETRLPSHCPIPRKKLKTGQAEVALIQQPPALQKWRPHGESNPDLKNENLPS